VKRQLAREEGGADQLVDRVVAADIFAEKHEIALGVEECGSVKAAGAIEDGLLATEDFREAMDDGGIDDRRILGQYRTALGVKGVDGGFSADSAARGGVEVAPEPLEVYCDSRSELDGDGVARLPGISAGLRSADAVDLAGAFEDAFGKQEAGSQLEVVARGPHGYGHRGVGEADFEGFFDGQ
jgi:hypothetical protein